MPSYCKIIALETKTAKYWGWVKGDQDWDQWLLSVTRSSVKLTSWRQRITTRQYWVTTRQHCLHSTAVNRKLFIPRLFHHFPLWQILVNFEQIKLIFHCCNDDDIIFYECSSSHKYHLSLSFKEGILSLKLSLILFSKNFSVCLIKPTSRYF